MAPRASAHPSARPAGVVTRGKTAPNRLRRVDHFLARHDPHLLMRRDGPFARAWVVDLGYGADPTTTLELAARLRRHRPDLPVLGLEIDPARVERARPHEDEVTRFRLGGFEVPLGVWPDGTPETVRAVRAFNVLRQYDEDEVAPTYDLLCARLLPGGLLLEGTSDPFGRVWCANVLRRPEATDPDADSPWRTEAFVLGTNFRDGFDPAVFQTRLPKSLIHRIVPGEPAHAFFHDWKAAAAATRAAAVWGPRHWFAASARKLAAAGWPLDVRPAALRRGMLVLRGGLAGAESRAA